MAINSGQIDLNADAGSFDRENEAFGFNSSGSNVNVGVSLSETLTDEPLGGEVQVQDQKVVGVNPGCDLMMNGGGNDGFVKQSELVDKGNDLEASVELVDEGCDGKACNFSDGLVKDEDKKSTIERSGAAPFVYGGTETGKGLVLELNDGVQNELACEHAMKVSGNGSLTTKVGSDNEPYGVDNLMECEKEEEDATLVNQQKCFVEVMDVDDAKQPAVMQNQTVDINITETGLFENIQNEFHGFNLVVDLNSYRNTLEVGIDRKSASSELNFCVSDLVWGKVRGHPWWPGQIVDPSAASEKAKRHIKEDCYLIAYFGDQTFAWNDASNIKPFRMHFSQLEKQTDLELFHHAIDCALDEILRRVEFGLSCPCMPEEVFSKLKTQVIINAGVHIQSSRRNGGDRFMNATSFEPLKLVNFLKSVAQSPLIQPDRLNLVIAQAELLSFYRSKGYSQLPEFILGGYFENDMEILFMREKEQSHDRIDGPGFSHKRKQISGNSMRPSKKHKLLSDLMSEKSFCIPNDKHALERIAGDKSISRCSGRKRKAASDDYFHKSQNGKLIQSQYVSIDEMWSQLCLAATDPAGESLSRDTVNFFAEFRNFIRPDDSAYLEQEISTEQMHVGETGVRSTEAVASMTSAMEPCKDSYWTDRIIQSISVEQSLSENQNEREEFLPETTTESGSSSFRSQPAAELSTNLDFMQQDTDRNLGSEPSKLEQRLDECYAEGTCPTALTLKFTNLDSVPSTRDLNKIFGRFGPLIESQTGLLKKSCRARVVFERRSDAETAFSSAGKYSIFGPSLVSYRLKILPSTSRKASVGAGKRGRKGRKGTSSEDDAAA